MASTLLQIDYDIKYVKVVLSDFSLWFFFVMFCLEMQYGSIIIS